MTSNFNIFIDKNRKNLKKKYKLQKDNFLPNQILPFVVTRVTRIGFVAKQYFLIDIFSREQGGPTLFEIY